MLSATPINTNVFFCNFISIRKKKEDGRWKMEDGIRKMEDGRWKME